MLQTCVERRVTFIYNLFSRFGSFFFCKIRESHKISFVNIARTSEIIKKPLIFR